MTNEDILKNLKYLYAIVGGSFCPPLGIREIIRELVDHFEAEVRQEEIDKTSMENTGLLCPKAKDVIYK